jgi:hypothetical protein
MALTSDTHSPELLQDQTKPAGQSCSSTHTPSRILTSHNFESEAVQAPIHLKQHRQLSFRRPQRDAMTVTPQSIVCKACAKTIATVSDMGLVPETCVTGAQGCDTCKQFRPLYDAMQAADEAYASFEKKPDNYKPKQAARASVRQIHMQLDNFLISVEGAAEDPPATLCNTHADSADHTATREGEAHGTKRPRSSSSISKGYSPMSPPSVHGTASLPERKRIKFSDSVEFRKDYRPSEYYSRNDGAYERGRYAPPYGGEHLDTSGHDKTFLKFTGMRKVGKKWVDVWKEDNDDDEREDGKEETTGNNKSVTNVQITETSSTVENHVSRPEVTSVAQRLVRRSSRTPQSLSTQNVIAAKPGRRQTKSTKMQTSSASTVSAPQLVDTARVVTEEHAMTGAYTANSRMDDEDKGTQSSSAQTNERSTAEPAASPYSAPQKDLTEDCIAGQRIPENSTPARTAEKHVLLSRIMADKKDQLGHGKQHVSNKTNSEPPEKQRTATCEVREQLGVADGPLAASKRADEPGGAEGDPPDEIKSLGVSLDDDADVTSDSKTGFQVFQFPRGGEGEVTTLLIGNFQAEVEAEETAAQKRNALSTPLHAPPHQASFEVPPTN